MKKEHQASKGIAVVGLACWYPGSSSLQEFWENILAKRQQFRRMPDCRLPLDQYHNADRSQPDKTYGTEAALIDGFEFDWRGRRIPKQVFESTDIVHWLALDVALKALDDARLDLATLQKLATGVVLGNTLTGEWTRTNAMRMRWPYMERVLRETAATRGLTGTALEDFVQATEQAFKSVFPSVNEDTLAGALSNTIAGRICNTLDLHGGGYTVDGACSSSLLAVITAARSLMSGDLDVAFAGGIDISLDTFELIGFAKTGALTPNEMRVYDKRGNGFIPGEGCGFVVLKRLEDAQRDGDRIYAVLQGWGLSSDGKGGITAPSIQGQAQAISKAYAMADYGLQDCHFIEGHGTGTALGDKVEISALATVLGEHTPSQPIGLTSLKSIVGHTKAAAGIGALIKSVIAVNQRILPPMAGVEDPHELFQTTARHFFPIQEARLLPEDTVIRAGVSAMGFGGINTHVTLESYGSPAEHLRPSAEINELLHAADKSEALVFSAPSQSLLQRKVDQVLSTVRHISRAELGDLAAELSRYIHPYEPYRATVVVTRPEEAYRALTTLRSWLDSTLPVHQMREALEGSTLIALGHSTKAPRLGFLFPGQGSQKIQMGRKLVTRSALARARLDEARAITQDVSGIDISQYLYPALSADPKEAQEALTPTERAQPAITLVNALWCDTLRQLGVQPSAVAGHSLGELSALYAAKAFDFTTLLRLAAKRGQLMSGEGPIKGSMIYLNCHAEEASLLLVEAPAYATLANRNAPDQTVIAGDPQALEHILLRAKARNISGGFLPVSHAFHSEYMLQAAEAFGSSMKKWKFNAPEITFFKGTDGQAWDAHKDQLKDYLSRQIVQQVDFISLIEHMSQSVDILLELGPGSVLASLAKRILSPTSPVRCLSIETRAGQDFDLKSSLAICFVKGTPIRWAELYRGRFVRPFVSPSDRLFIESPTERPLSIPPATAALSLAPHTASAPLVQRPVVVSQPTVVVAPTPTQMAPIVVASSSRVEPGVLEVLFRIVEELTGFEAATLRPEMRVLDDLNMDSIKASELVANAAMHYGIAGELEAVPFANASLKELAEAIESKRGDIATPMAPTPSLSVAPPPPTPAPPPPVDKSHKPAESSKAQNKEPWVRNFREDFVLNEEESAPPFGGPVTWIAVLGDRTDLEGLQLEAQKQGMTGTVQRFDEAQPQPLPMSQGEATIVLMPERSEDFAADMRLYTRFLASLGASRWPRGHRLAFVQFDDGLFGHGPNVSSSWSAKALAQSLSHERPDLKIRIMSFAPKWRDEPARLSSYLSAVLAGEQPLRIDAIAADGQRRRPQLQLSEPAHYEARGLNWSTDDVILVTGGAKGITAACAFALAETHGCRMALVGSSRFDPDRDREMDHPIRLCLDRYQNAGLVARYYACDLSSPEAVRDLINKVKAEMGVPTALIHGAGINQPRPFSSVTPDQAWNEMQPKVLGLAHLLDQLEADRLKLIIGLSSVIGVLGMPGNAWYGFANETLDLMLRTYAKRYPNVQTQALAYSVWAELGMGARMGSDKNLESKGISSIPPQEGIARFLRLFQCRDRDQQTIISSRLGSIGQQARTEHLDVNAISFVDTILHHQADVECIVRSRLTLESHPYLKDHNYKGAYLLPTVFGLEAMAQVAHILAPWDRSQGLILENIRLARPITVGAQGTELEIYAERLETEAGQADPRLRVGIRTALTGYKLDHFSAEFVLNTPVSGALNERPELAEELPISPQEQLYGSILWQGPSFQRLSTLFHLESDNETAGCTVFRSKVTAHDCKQHLLADPYFRDSLLQSAQIIIPQNQCLPIAIDRLELHAGFQNPVERLIVTDVHKADERSYVATITVFDTEGRILERLVDYRLQYLEKRPGLPKAMDLLLPRSSVSQSSDEKLLAPYRSVADRLRIDAESDGPQEQAVFVHRFIPDFKTFANLNRSIYFSHFFNWMGSAREMSSLPVLDRIRALTETGRWGLVTNWASIEVLGECRNKDRVVEARMWCGRITGSQGSSATLSFDWVSRGENGIEERIAIGHMGFTWVEILDHGVVRPAPFPEYYQDFIASMIAKTDAPDSYLPAPEPFRRLDRGETLYRAPEGPQAAVRLSHKIYETGLFDANLVGNLYFGNYSIWMGKLRDSSFYEIAPHYFRGVGEAGELTCVQSRIQHLREAMPFDEIYVTMGLKALHIKGVELQFDFYKILADGSHEKLATADHHAVWTRRGTDGELEAIELPSDIRQALIERIEDRLVRRIV